MHSTQKWAKKSFYASSIDVQTKTVLSAIRQITVFKYRYTKYILYCIGTYEYINWYKTINT